MWILRLNDMRSPKAEILTDVAKAETKEALLAFLAREAVETYQDGQWFKSYRSGGMLEWYNRPVFHDECHHFMDIKTLDFWMLDAIETTKTNWHYKVDPLPTV